jgi:hypothetical protein
MAVNLTRGDIVFTADAKGSIMHAIIATAQRAGSPFSGGHANSVHVAIATGNNLEVVEAVGGGLKERPLKHGNFRVFSYVGPMAAQISDFAVMVAESHLTQGDFTNGWGNYNKGKATVCPFRWKSGGQNVAGAQTQQFGQGAQADSSFFCSNFVWRCYTAAAEIQGLVQLPIPNSHSQISPRDLEALLGQSANWQGQNGGHSMSNP